MSSLSTSHIGLPTGTELQRLRASFQPTGLRHVQITYAPGQVLPSKAQVRVHAAVAVVNANALTR